MKTAVVFYSKDGSTKVAAQILGEKLGADVFELEELKKRGSSPLSFMAAGFGAAVGKKSRIKSDYAAQMGAYGKIFIGSPVWASRCVPAVNTFVDRLDAKGKTIIVFTVQADKSPSPKAAEPLVAALEKKGAASVSTLCLYGQAPGKTADRSDMEKQIEPKM